MYMPRSKGLIVLEGLDAAGKNSQARLLASHFEGYMMTAFIYSFPRYGTTVGKAILRHLKGEIVLADGVQAEVGPLSGMHDTEPRRALEDALAFQCLMLADKMEAAGDIYNHMQLGRVVICDRWYQSAVAFGAADGLDEDWLHKIHDRLPQPWLNIFIDVPPEEALRRRPEARDRYERDREKQKIVRANYEKLWTNAGADYVKIDGVGAQDEVHERIWAALENRP
jgi:dTMP kinase